MALHSKYILSCLAVTIVLIAYLVTNVCGDHSKIRIHVPVKHHTHFHTKTIVKTVHVPIKIKSNHHHHHLIDDDADIAWAKSYPKKKKIRPVFY